MTADDLDLIAGHLRNEKLEFRRELEGVNRAIEQVCFPETAVISVVACTTEGRSIEAGLIGYEGVSGLPVLFGDDRSPNEAYVQIAGDGYVMASDDLRTAVDTSPTLRSHLLRFAQTFTVLVAQTALANGRAKIDERLARWLLMASDRTRSHELTLTHELISLMLGVRRPGVTDAIHRLEGERLIKARRSSITIRDRAGLEAAANGSYGVAERNYERLFGPIRFEATDMQAGQRRSA